MNTKDKIIIGKETLGVRCISEEKFLDILQKGLQDVFSPKEKVVGVAIREGQIRVHTEL